MNENPFRLLHHICIVVHDLDKTVAYYENLGIGPRYDYPKGGLYVELEVEDAEASSAMRLTSAPISPDNVQLQLCQPPQLDCPRSADSSKQMAKVCSTWGSKCLSSRRRSPRCARPVSASPRVVGEPTAPASATSIRAMARALRWKLGRPPHSRDSRNVLKFQTDHSLDRRPAYCVRRRRRSHERHSPADTSRSRGCRR